MKKNYQKPTTFVVKIQHLQMLTTSPGYEVIGPDEPNIPAG